MTTSQQTSGEATKAEPRSIAVVSGKGGSGKTMIVAVMARILDSLNLPTIIVDADTGTGGLTYYLGLKKAGNISVGLADAAAEAREFGDLKQLPEGSLQPLRSYKDSQFFGLGDHDRLYEDIPEESIPDVLKQVLRKLRDEQRWMVIDCRGGIDRESIAVCETVDDIIIIAESDTTSLQATQHLVKVLSEKKLSRKLRGFIINKVFDDPTVISQIERTAFRCQYLYSIPFDLTAMRSFTVGEVPSTHSLLGTHTWQSLHVYGESVPGIKSLIPPPETRPWTPKEFREVGLANLDSVRGGLFVAGLICMFGIIYLNFRLTEFYYISSTTISITLIVLGLVGSVEPTRRTMGRAVDLYLRAFKSLFKRKEEE